MTQQAAWSGAVIDRIVYCTARIDAATNPSGFADQDVYLKALLASGSVDHIEYGNYVSNLKYTVLARRDSITKRPVVVTADWPVKVQDGAMIPLGAGTCSCRRRHPDRRGRSWRAGRTSVSR